MYIEFLGFSYLWKYNTLSTSCSVCKRNIASVTFLIFQCGQGAYVHSKRLNLFWDDEFSYIHNLFGKWQVFLAREPESIQHTHACI